MFWILLLAIVGATIAAAYLVRRKWIIPWRELEQLVRQIGRGEQPRTFLIGGGAEARRVSLALENILSRQRELDRDAAKRASERSAIFSAMQDGVLVLDGDRRIALFNTTFQKLFGLNERSLGEPLLEMVREATIEKLVSETFKKHEPTRGEITLAERHWQVSAEPMHDGNGAKSGAVVLFHDITALKRADEMRRDFVANVSHELRTPLSLIHI